MAFSVFKGTLTIPAATGNQAITGVGFQPKVLMLWVTADKIFDSTFVDDALLTIGFMSSTTNEHSAGAIDKGNALAAETARRVAQRALSVPLSDGTEDVGCDLASFDADGFTLNWTNVGNAYVVHFLALGGADLTNAAVINWDRSAGTGNQGVTGVGFQPDLVLHLATDQSGALPLAGAEGVLSLGAMDGDGNQWCVGFNAENAKDPMDVQRGQLTSDCLFTLSISETFNGRTQFVSMDADGFTVNKVGDRAMDVVSLCIKGPRFKAGAFNKSTSAAPASQQVTGIGFEPDGLILASFELAATASAQAHMVLSLGATDGTREGAAAVRSEDARGTSDTQSIAKNDKLLVIPDEASIGTINSECDFSSFGSDGFTISWSTNDTGIASQILYIALASNGPPNAPTLVAPANNAVENLAAGFPFDWTFSDPDPGDSQSAWAMRRKVGGGAYEYYRVSDGTWQAIEQWNTDAAEQFTFPAGKWTSGTVYNWSVATKDAIGNAGPYATDRVVEASTAPVVNVTGPADPETGTAQPTVIWTYFDAESEVQASYRVKVFSSTQYTAFGFDPDTSTPTWDSTTTAGTATSRQVGTNLTNGVTYRAYVMATADNGQESAWDFQQFLMDLTTPDPPSLTCFAEVATARVRIELVEVTADTDYFTVERSDDGGVTYDFIRDGEQIINTGSLVTVYDYEAPREKTVLYRAAAVNAEGGNVLVSDYSTCSVLLNNDGNEWLKDPTDPDLNQPVCLIADGNPLNYERASFEDQTTFEPLGRSTPVIVGGTIRSEAMPVTFYFGDDAAWEAWEDLRATRRTLLLQTQSGDSGMEQFYVRLGPERFLTTIVTHDSQTTQRRIARTTAREVDKP